MDTMDIKLVIQILTSYLLPKALSQVEFQYYHQDQINGYRLEEYPDYENAPIKHLANHKISEDYNEYVDDFNECRCLCNTCVDLQSCCKSVCINCVTPQSSVMFVPYAYPIIVTENNKDASDKNNIDTTTLSTTLKTTTTTIATTKFEATETTEIITTRVNSKEAEIILPDPKMPDLETQFSSTVNIPKTILTDNDKPPYQLIDKNSKYAVTSLRRTKSNWLPKYGIVPIPDQLAEKILLQLRNMKVLHPTHNNMRPIDFLNKYKN